MKATNHMYITLTASKIKTVSNSQSLWFRKNIASKCIWIVGCLTKLPHSDVIAIQTRKTG